MSLLIFQMGLIDVVASHFQQLLEHRVHRFEVVNVPRGHSPKHAMCEYDGIIITGSSFMVTDNADWSVKFAKFIREIIRENKHSVLGICYGHQIVCEALGSLDDDFANVNYLFPRQLGLAEYELDVAETQSDPLFSVFNGAKTIKLHIAHRQRVVKIPKQSKVLGYRKEIDPFAIVKHSSKCWTIQAHPEMDSKFVKRIVSFQKDSLIKDGFDYDKLYASIGESEDGMKILARFCELVSCSKNNGGGNNKL